MFIPKPIYFTRSLPEGVIQQEELDPFLSAQMILDEAKKLGIGIEIIPDTDIIQLAYKGNVQSFRNRVPGPTTYIGRETCYDKQLCKIMLQRAGLAVAPGYTVYETDSDERIMSIWQDLQKPLVLKPAKGTHGNGVEIGLNDFSDCVKKIRAYFRDPQYPGTLILEEMFVGREYRILASKEKVVAILERIPAHVIGDGQHTIDELLQIENKNPLRNISEFLYPHISLDAVSLQLLAQQKLTRESVPSKDQHVQLQKISNIMAGGVAIDRTDEAHESVKEIALQAVRAIPGLSWTGIDFMTTNLSIPQLQKGYIIIEMNSSPEFAMHDLPMQGKPRDVTREFILTMFPELR